MDHSRQSHNETALKEVSENEKYLEVLIAILVLLSVFSMAIAETSGLGPEKQSEAKRILVVETTDIHG